jgi:hypothetical protein
MDAQAIAKRILKTKYTFFHFFNHYAHNYDFPRQQQSKISNNIAARNE